MNLSATKTEPVKPGKQETWVCVLILVAACFLIYYPNLARDNFFLGDDFGVVQVLHGKPVQHFFKLFYSDWTEGIYGYTLDELRPTSAFTFKMDWDLWGLNMAGFGYHLTNLVLHMLNVLLVFWMTRTLAGKNNWIGVVAGLFFLASPVNAEPVGWIGGRVDLIPFFFYFGAFFCFTRFREEQSYLYYGLAVVLFGLGLFTKQSVITFPAVIVAYDLLYRGRMKGESFFGQLLKQAVAYLPFLVLLGVYLYVRLTVFGNAVRENALGMEFIKMFIDRQSFYLGALLLPVNLVFHEQRVLPIALTGISVGIFFIWAVSLWRNRATQGEAIKHILFYGPFWYTVAVLPLLVVPYISTRHLYHAAGGLSIALAFLIAPMSIKRAGRFTVAQVVTIAFLLGFYGMTLIKVNGNWIAAGKQSMQMGSQIEQTLKTIPEGSRVMLVFPSFIERGTWGWTWSLPFALQKPYHTEDFYAKYQIIESAHTYCCPIWNWLEARGPFIRALVADTEASTPLYIVYWDDNTSAIASKIKNIPGEPLKAYLEASLKKPLDDLMKEITPEEAEQLIQSIAGYSE